MYTGPHDALQLSLCGKTMSMNWANITNNIKKKMKLSRNTFPYPLYIGPHDALQQSLCGETTSMNWANITNNIKKHMKISRTTFT